MRVRKNEYFVDWLYIFRSIHLDKSCLPKYGKFPHSTFLMNLGDFEYFLKNPLYIKELYISKNLHLDDINDFCPIGEERHLQTRKMLTEIALNENSKNEKLLDVLISLKQTIIDLSSQIQNKVKDKIDNIFEMPLIEKEIQDMNPTNLGYRLGLILTLMGEICAPARDIEIKELIESQSPSIEFLGKILNVTDHMRLDLCNAYMNMKREYAIEHSISYEAAIFDAYCKQSSESIFPNTSRYIHKAVEFSLPLIKIISLNDVDDSTVDYIIYKFQKIVMTQDHIAETPETMILDEIRLRIHNSFVLYSIFVATLLNLLKQVLAKLKDYDIAIDSKVVAIAFNLDRQEMHNKSKMRLIASDIMKFLCNSSIQFLGYTVDENFQTFFVTKIEQLVDRNDPVWSLFKSRVEDAVFGDEKCLYQQIQPHISIQSLSDPLNYMRDSTKRYQTFNRCVYLSLYKSIIMEHIQKCLALV